MNKLMLIRSCGLVAHGFCLKSSFVLGTAIALFVCYSFFTFPTLHCAEYVSMKIVSSFLPPCVVNLGFLSSVFTVEVDQFKTRENSRHVCNLKVVHNHQLTWLWLFEDRIMLSTG